MTTTFVNFVCWRDDSVLAMTPRDAASLTDGRFQAIHHPLRLRRRRLDHREGGTWTSEADVVTALKGALRPDGYLFIPVVGGSGTGKSHLVRWVKDQTEGESGWEIRYLPKNRTGLRRAIEIVIRGLDGPKIEEVREALATAPSHTESDAILAERLLDELALLVSQLDDDSSTPASDPPGDKKAALLRKRLSLELPDLLRDPVMRRKLTASGAVIPRLVGLALRGRQEGDGLDDDATQFLDADLPLSFEEIGNASKGARDLLRKFATLPDYKLAAVAMINEVLPSAEKHVAVSNQVDLVEVFREVRRALHSDGKQLVLFVEDLTVLHGVEREFLDAIVEPAHSPDGDMCSLRMIFAVTEGHFDDLDTVRTRCDDAYWLDAGYGDGVDEDEALSFVARYFNATRLDPAEIDAAWTSRRGGTEIWLRNACDSCVFQEECHESFGVSHEGYGLYPLNVEAAGRFVRALSSERFDPRDIVRELVNRFLVQGSRDMQTGRFPSSSTLEQFNSTSDPLPALIGSRVEALRPIDYERIRNILRYWAGIESYSDVSGAVLTAFGAGDFVADLPSLRNLDTDTAEKDVSHPRPKGDDGSRRGVADLLKSDLKKQFTELTAWGSGQHELSATTTRELRKSVRTLIRNNLELGPLPVNLGPSFDEHRFGDGNVVIEGSVTTQAATSAFIAIERNEANAAALEALVLAQSKDVGLQGYPQASAYRQALASAVERWTATVTARLDQPVASATTAAVHGAIVASAVIGKLGRAASPSDYIAALFGATPPQQPKVTGRTAKWAGLLVRASELKSRVQGLLDAEFGEARGAGAIRMIQADRLFPIVTDFASTWTLDTTDAAIGQFMRAVQPAVDEEWRQLNEQVTAALPLVERGRAWEDQTAKVLTVLRAGVNSGRLDDNDALEELTAIAGRDPARALRAFYEAADAVGRDTPLVDKIAMIAGDVPAHVASVHAFAVRASAAMASIERDLANRPTSAGGDSDLQRAAAQVLKVTERFADVVKGLSQ